ncbi:MAG: hypothetical protein JO353_08325 [Phycisphaerae bacterium]|nr:hypothetical protein [Phycisphaerae bacterium]
MLTGQVIYSLLSGNSTVASMTGGRIAPSFQAQAAADFPNIYFYSTNTDQQQTLAGPNVCALEENVKIVVQANSYAEMVALTMAVISAMRIIRNTIAGIPVQGVFFKDSDESELNIPDLGNSFVVNVNEIEFKIIFDLPS